MKVWIVTNAYLPEKGGLVSYTRSLALQLLREGKKVEIITSNLKNNNLHGHELIEGIEVTRIDYSGIPKWLKLLTPLIFFYRTFMFIKSSSIAPEDIVISRFYTFALAVSKAKKVKKHIFITPLVATRLQYIEAKRSSGGRKLYLFFTLPQVAFLDKLAICSTPFLGVLSKSKQEEVSDYYNVKKGKVSVIPPGVDLERFRVADDEKKMRLRKQLGYRETDKIVVCVSRLSTEKNLEILLHALNDIEDENIKIAFVGEGQCRVDLEKKVASYKQENKVKFWGARDNVEDFYNMSDVFILPSKYEGFGHVYIEALACGLPSIGAKSSPPVTVTASDEIIVNEKLGQLVNYNDKNEIIQAIQYCLETSKEYRYYRRQYVQNNFSWHKHFEIITNVLEGR